MGNQTFFMFSAYLANLFVPLAWVLSIYGWSIARRTFQAGGVDASFGPAVSVFLWLSTECAIRCIDGRAGDCRVMFLDGLYRVIGAAGLLGASGVIGPIV